VNLDLALLALVLTFAILGAFAGAARQVAQLVAIGVGYFCAKPIGAFLGPKVAAGFNLPLVLGVVGATFAVFVAMVMLVRYLLTFVLRRIISGGDPRERALDRGLGFVLGGAKVALFAYVVLCALAFVESNIAVAGKQLGVSPKDSIAFTLAKKHNVFQLAQFSQVEALSQIAKARNDPKKAGRLRGDPAFKALTKDPRFAKALDDPALRAALVSGNYQALLRSNPVMQLLQDPTAAERLSAAAAAAEGRGPR
jgi:membrane protein required for colicin V production